MKVRLPLALIAAVVGVGLIPEDEFALEWGFFAFKVNLTGEGGLFGTVDFLLRREQNGDELIRDRGSCHFA
jgi:hypothetical protein